MIRFDLQTNISASLEKFMSESPQKVRQIMEVSLFSIGQQMSGTAATDAPFKTGNLRRSVTSNATETEVRVGSNLIYARIHDVGGMAGRGRSVRINPYKGRGYLTPQFNKMKDGEALRIIEKNFMDLLK